MILSDKEIELYNFIRKITIEKGGATIKDIEDVLGTKAVGGLGKLLKLGDIEKKKIREGEGYNVKIVVHYILKEKNDSENTEERDDISLEYLQAQSKEYKDMKKVLYNFFKNPDNDTYYPEYIESKLKELKEEK